MKDIARAIMFPMLLSRAFFVVVVAVVVSPLASACYCASFGNPDPCGNPGKKGVLFVGTVLEIQDENSSFSKRVRVRVDDAFSGVVGKEIIVRTGRGGGDCGVLFQVGEQWLIDGIRGQGGKVHAGICSGTAKVQFAAAAVRQLRALRSGRKPASLTGMVFRSNAGKRDHVPNVIVEARGEKQTFQARSDEHGVYAFDRLPPGTYVVVVQPIQAKVAGLPVGSYPHKLRTLELVVGSCANRNVYVDD